MQAKIYSKEIWIKETNPQILFNDFKNLLLISNFTIIDHLEHYFEPFGYTAIFLLAESHFAIHTFPEENKTYILISSCNKIYYDNFISMLNDYLSTNKKH